jgi:hypothetical protein
MIVVAVLVCAAIAGCGGSSHNSSGTSTTTTPKVSTTTTTPVHAAPPVLRQLVRSSTSTTLAPTLTGKPGEAVAFYTSVPTTAPETVTLRFPSKRGRSLVITAKAGGQAARATITSATGKPLTLQALHYACELPPAPTFCPANKVTTSPTATKIEFSASHASGVAFSGVIGPIRFTPPPTVAPGPTVVPPYTVTEVLRVRPPKPPPGPVAAATPRLSAHPGDTVLMYSVLKGEHGAVQPITVTINQGPGNVLTISAAAAGGQPSSAEVISATGQPITLIIPRYSCFLPPVPTFCPATKVTTATHKYNVTFNAAPGTPTVTIDAEVGTG